MRNVCDLDDMEIWQSGQKSFPENIEYIFQRMVLFCSPPLVQSDPSSLQKQWTGEYRAA